MLNKKWNKKRTNGWNVEIEQEELENRAREKMVSIYLQKLK